MAPAMLSMRARSAAATAGTRRCAKFSRRVVRVAATSEDSTPSAPSIPPKGQAAIEYAKSLPGISQPFPDMFDPAGFVATASPKEVKRWRESEITHGRVAMLASLGFIVQEQLEDFPAFYNYDGHITGPAITQFQQVESRGAIFWEPLVFAIGLAEAYRVGLGWATPKGEGFNSLKEEYEPGTLGFDPLNLLPSDPEEAKIMKTKELNNGRLAMIAIAAFVAQELVEQTEIFEHLFVNVEKEVVAEEGTVAKELASAL